MDSQQSAMAMDMQGRALDLAITRVASYTRTIQFEYIIYSIHHKCLLQRLLSGDVSCQTYCQQHALHALGPQNTGQVKTKELVSVFNRINVAYKTS